MRSVYQVAIGVGRGAGVFSLGGLKSIERWIMENLSSPFRRAPVRESKVKRTHPEAGRF
ncbi:MAG: hypothetical protein JRJ66_13140 [Deltaproteobacteria bacterium]|nr:hypothetical protein [Deltaproteobacteria bacterium]